MVAAIELELRGFDQVVFNCSRLVALAMGAVTLGRAMSHARETFAGVELRSFAISGQRLENARPALVEIALDASATRAFDRSASERYFRSKPRASEKYVITPIPFSRTHRFELGSRSRSVRKDCSGAAGSDSWVAVPGADLQRLREPFSVVVGCADRAHFPPASPVAHRFRAFPPAAWLHRRCASWYRSM